jgi:outer membrane protein insertion porin family
MIFPRRGSAFTLGLQLTPPVSYFKKENFWKVSDAEKLVIRDKMTDENPLFSSDMITKYTDTEIESRENKSKFKFIEYHKWTFNGTWYTNLFGNLVLATKTEFGYLGYYNPAIGTSPFEKFDVGGSGMMGYDLYGTDIVALRGYPDGSLTPETTIMRNGYPVSISNGNVYVKYSLEMRYLISPNPQATIYGLAFVDAGNAWTNIQSFNPFTVKRSAGIGVRAFLPMFGMLGIDWGYGFDLPNSNLSTEDRTKGHHGSEFHFVMGQQF